MNERINRERVNDTAKLIMHRLIAREIGRDPSLIERVRGSLGHRAEHLQHRSFVQDWHELLDLPLPEIRHRITSRDEDMTRLRLSSPFVLAQGINFEDEALRRRIWRAAKRIAIRSLVQDRADDLWMTS
jgi:hypothetical protein